MSTPQVLLLKTYKFNMAMTCESCANAAKKVLGKLGSAVISVETDVASKTVTVVSTLGRDEIQAALVKTGKEVTAI